MERINVMAFRHSAFYTPLLVTLNGGFLQQQGLEADYSVATPQRTVADALARGEIDLAQSAVATSFAGLEQDKPIDIVHFAQINRLDGFFLAGRKAEPDFDWSRLVGREVLVDHLFQPLAMFRYALQRHGIEPSQVQIVDAGSVEEMDRAFRAGRGDYIHQQGPFPQQLEQDGVGHLVASVGESVGPVAFSSLCATRAWLGTAQARAFMRAYRQACRFVLEAPAGEIAALEQNHFPEIEPAVLTRTIATYQRMGTWSADPRIDAQTYEHLLDVYQYNGLVTRRHAYGSCVVAPPDSDAA
ncbi:MAG: ABC transporter substrate-binding protein [Candidatus Thiodiazotropha sp.]